MRNPIDFDHYGYKFLDRGNWGELHPGVDLNGPGGGNADLGAPIYAPADGEITHVARGVKSWGNHFHLKFESPFGTRWCHFAHCQDIFVIVGQLVKEGERIATIGNSGGDWTAHLHYETKKKPTGVAFYPTPETTKEWILEYYEDPIVFIEKVNKEQSYEDLVNYLKNKGVAGKDALAYVQTVEQDREKFMASDSEKKGKLESYENLRDQLAELLNCPKDFPAILGEAHRLIEETNDVVKVEKERDMLKKAVYDTLGDTTMSIDDISSLSRALHDLVEAKKIEIERLTIILGDKNAEIEQLKSGETPENWIKKLLNFLLRRW